VTLPADHASRANIPPGQPILLSAASFEALARQKGRPGALDVPKVPSHVPEIAVDPGGFVAATRGGYRFSWADYEEWLARLGPRLSWAAFPDLPCEQSLAPLDVQVRVRQEQTLQWAWELWGGDDDTENRDSQRSRSWAYVATVQGRTVDQYTRHAEQLAPLLAQQFDQYHHTDYGLDLVDLFGEDQARATRAWAQHAARHHRVGIGSLCGRNQPSEVAELVRIVTAVAEVLPGPFHLLGRLVGVICNLPRT